MLIVTIWLYIPMSIIMLVVIESTLYNLEPVVIMGLIL